MQLCYWCVVYHRLSQFNNDTPLRGARTMEHSLDNVIKLIIQALHKAHSAILCGAFYRLLGYSLTPQCLAFLTAQ